MTTIVTKGFILLLALIIVLAVYIQSHSYHAEMIPSKSALHRKFRRAACPDSKMCLSRHGFCGLTEEYCGEGCKEGPCSNKKENKEKQKKLNGSTDIINEERFRCVFNELDEGKRRERFRGLQNSSYKPQNIDEAAVFLAHVHHETDGLKTLVEYCAPSRFLISYLLSISLVRIQVVVQITINPGVISKVRVVKVIMVAAGYNCHIHATTMPLEKLLV